MSPTPTRRRFLAAAGAAVTGSLAGCTVLASDGPEYDVGMTAVAFDPPTVRTAPGEEVVWLNTSSRGHTVTAYDDRIPEAAAYFASGGYDSETAARDAWRADLGGLLAGGETYSHVFDAPGTYTYVCLPHEQAGMVGTVVVE